MFDRIREVIKKMFGQREIKDKLGFDVVMSSDMAAAVKTLERYVLWQTAMANKKSAQP